ncbi:ABC transporter ATP-binding protein [Gracilibacillus phocaeensis]|uniref:ABC transporter ATP-binding protein n=1 Tax=Gracilibacillus phocaeensis TaxID=2042304 RepID=UPI00102FFAC6|nr:ABC transporter ATP-binding protein [Gracilibacillus phocaeensis]
MINITNLQKSFGKKVVFDDFHLQVEPGEFVGIIGKSGSGKSTLLNIVGTLEDPDSGKIEILGREVKRRRDKIYMLRNHMGFIFQNYALIDNASVYENLEIALKHKKMGNAKQKQMISTALQKVKMEHYHKEKIFRLSGGEQQRIAIARLLLKDPKLILADEPTGSLDTENRDLIFSLFKDLHNQGKTILMVTHDKELINYFTRTIQL